MVKFPIHTAYVAQRFRRLSKDTDKVFGVHGALEKAFTRADTKLDTIYFKFKTKV